MSDELLLLLIVVCYQVVLTEKSKKFTNSFRYRLADGSCRHWSICTRRGRQWASSTLQGLDSSQAVIHPCTSLALNHSVPLMIITDECTDLISIYLRRLTYLVSVMMQQYLLLWAGACCLDTTVIRHRMPTLCHPSIDEMRRSRWQHRWCMVTLVCFLFTRATLC